MGSQASIPIRGSAVAGASPEPAALASAAHALCDAGRTMEAETIARWLIHQHPQFSGARIVLGRVLFEQDRLSEAADVLRATTIQYPASVAAYRWLAEVLVRQGLWARARAVLHQAAMLSPANRRIGQLQRLAGQTSERGQVLADDSTTRAMNLEEPPPRPVLPPIPAQALSAKERRNRLTEEDPTPTGIAPPATPLYARADFASLPTHTPAPAALRAPKRDTLEWPAAPLRSSQPELPTYAESAGINLVLPSPTGEPTAVERTPSVTWQGIPLLDRHWKQRWKKGVTLIAALIATACLGFLGLRWVVLTATPSNAARESDHATDHQNELPRLNEALALATPASLNEVIENASKRSTPEATAAANLARALLLVEYGGEYIELSPANLPPKPSAFVTDASLSAATLAALGQGQLVQARSMIQGAQAVDVETPWVSLSQARMLQRIGNTDAAREKVATLPMNLPVVALLAAELAIDDARPNEALQLLEPLVAQGLNHPRVSTLMAQARVALHAEQAPAQNNCEAALPPNLLLDCQAQAASLARRKGQRAQAIALLTDHKVEGKLITDPRALSDAIVTLANLGQLQATKPLAERLNQLAHPAFPSRAWSELAVALSSGPQSAKMNAPAQPLTTETRLLASRAAFARGGARSLSATLGKIGTAAIGADDDLRWWRLLTRYGNKSGMQISSKLMQSRRPMGPVGAFVAGLLAENSRRLTSYWMALALTAPTHGDRCWAAALYAQAQRNLGKDPAQFAAYRALANSGVCR